MIPEEIAGKIVAKILVEQKVNPPALRAAVASAIRDAYERAAKEADEVAAEYALKSETVISEGDTNDAVASSAQWLAGRIRALKGEG